MGRLLIGTSLSLVLLAAACASDEVSGPTFQVNSPTLASTSTTVPSTLEFVGLPDLTEEENAMCEFIEVIGRDIEASDNQSRTAAGRKDAILSDRTLSEPLQVRRIRDIDVANAQRFANVLRRFEAATGLIDAIEPGPLADQDTLAADAADAALLSSIGAALQETIDEVKPLDAAEQADYKERTGDDWTDLFTTRELDDVLATLNNDSTGMGREAEARDAMERLDDWSWRHCAAGLTD